MHHARHVERVCGDEVRDGHVLTDQHRARLEVLLHDRGHVEEILAREGDLRGQPLLDRILVRVARDAPDRLLELRHREEQPAIHLRTGSQVGGEEPLLRILLREVQHDRDRFAQHEVVIDEDGDLASGIHGQELRPAVLALREVHLDVLEIEVQLPQHPQGTDGARRSKTVELHRDASNADDTLSARARYERNSGARSVIALTTWSASNPSSSAGSEEARWIQNVRTPAEAAPLMSQEFAEMNPSSGFFTFRRSGPRL